ncbi:hypothetical protein SRHO_G00116120 [Serrasalmus rhombeus]
MGGARAFGACRKVRSRSSSVEKRGAGREGFIHEPAAPIQHQRSVDSVRLGESEQWRFSRRTQSYSRLWGSSPSALWFAVARCAGGHLSGQY